MPLKRLVCITKPTGYISVKINEIKSNSKDPRDKIITSFFLVLSCSYFSEIINIAISTKNREVFRNGQVDGKKCPDTLNFKKLNHRLKSDIDVSDIIDLNNIGNVIIKNKITDKTTFLFILLKYTKK